jgi:transcription termination factor NusB
MHAVASHAWHGAKYFSSSSASRSLNGMLDKLLRALVVQLLYSIRSEPLLMEEVDDNILAAPVPREHPHS